MEHYQAKAIPKRLPARAVGFLFAALLQAGFVWALVAGLDVKQLTQPLLGPIETFFVKPKIVPVQPPPADPEIKPREVFVPQPELPPIDDGRRDTGLTGGTSEIHAVTPTAPGDHGPVSLAASHTIPPYPPMDIRLGNQGVVLLRLLVGPDGRVLDAQILRSSGAEGLDKAAQAWVIRHWRYQPAIRGGAAVQGAVDVAVKFDLKTAG